jgi:hypothetical protein
MVVGCVEHGNNGNQSPNVEETARLKQLRARLVIDCLCFTQCGGA